MPNCRFCCILWHCAYGFSCCIKASVVPAVAAPPSPCMSSCGTPQSPCNLFAQDNSQHWTQYWWSSVHLLVDTFPELARSYITPWHVHSHSLIHVQYESWFLYVYVAFATLPHVMFALFFKADRSNLWAHRRKFPARVSFGWAIGWLSDWYMAATCDMWLIDNDLKQNP